MKQSVQLAFAISLVLVIAACSPASPAVQEAISSPQAAGAYHPFTMRTGMEEIDNILDVLAAGDAEQLRSLVQFTNAECTQAEGLGGPPKCRTGEAEGTPVEVLPFLGSEGSFLRKDEIGNWPGVDAEGLYAVYKVSPAVTFEQYYPAGEYVVMLVRKENQDPILLRVDGGRIVRVDYLPGATLEMLNTTLQNEAAAVILEPVNP